MLASVVEALYPDRIRDVAKYRFHGTQTLTVDIAPFQTVNLALYAFNNTFFSLRCDIQCNIDLARCFLPFISQTAFTHSTVCAVLLVGLKLHEPVVADAGTPGFQPHGFSRRAAAGAFGLVNLEFGAGKACFFLLAVSFLRRLVILEARVA